MCSLYSALLPEGWQKIRLQTAICIMEFFLSPGFSGSRPHCFRLWLGGSIRLSFVMAIQPANGCFTVKCYRYRMNYGVLTNVAYRVLPAGQLTYLLFWICSPTAFSR